MKYLIRANIDDNENLQAIADNRARDLHHHPAIVLEILDQYQRYIEAEGNAGNPRAPVALRLAPALKRLLKGHYRDPPAELAFIDQFRGSATDVCPMCGGTNCSTIDHIFPQSQFAEFAFFSWNLVPACGCNVQRNDAYCGDQPGERVLHPYFDACLADRLVRAEITAVEGRFESPNIALLVLMEPDHSARAALSFHLREIVFKTFIERHWIQLWGKLRRGPEMYFYLPPGAITAEQMTDAVTQKLQDTDAHFGTPNNWDSMLFAGVAASAEAKEYLQQRVGLLRARGLRRSLD